MPNPSSARIKTRMPSIASMCSTWPKSLSMSRRAVYLVFLLIEDATFTPQVSIEERAASHSRRIHADTN
jgi:hypothetical protein